MNKIKLIIHERFIGKQSLEDVVLSAFQSESCQLLQDNSSGIMSVTKQSQDPFYSRKELKNRTDDIIYNAALYFRLSKDDEQTGESVSIGTHGKVL